MRVVPAFFEMFRSADLADVYARMNLDGAAAAAQGAVPSASASTLCTIGMRQPPPSTSTASKGDSATSAVLSTPSSSARSLARGSAQRAQSSSRDNLSGASMPSRRFSAVAAASPIVESSLRKRSMAVASRRPRLVPGTTLSP